jgi:hypothetical protein
MMWVATDVLSLFSIKVGPFSNNVVRQHLIFSANVGQTADVIGPGELRYRAATIRSLHRGAGDFANDLSVSEIMDLPALVRRAVHAC